MEIINKNDGRDFSKAISLQMSNEINRECVEALIANDGYQFAIHAYTHCQGDRGIYPTLKGLDGAYKLLDREQQLRCDRVFNNLIRQDYY